MMRNRFQCLVLGLSVLLILAAVGVAAAAEKGDAMSYADAKAYFAGFIPTVELTSPSGGRVLICPTFQGRVMTSACAPDGLSFGFINREFIEADEPNKHINNWGGEDRLWLSPEGGQFSLWFKPGVKQTLADWYTPPALNEGAWKVVSSPGATCLMTARMKFENASATPFCLDVLREVRLLDREALTNLFGAVAADMIAHPSVKSVGYETANSIQNCGEPMTKAKGLVSLWILGMMNAGPETIVMVPYKPGEESALGPVVKSDYFGAVPPERLKITPHAILFRADNHWRSKIGVSQRRARNTLGSIDFENNVLTLVHFNMPEDPTKRLYMNNMWGGPHAHPYIGDVVNSYNDGPPAPGQKGPRRLLRSRVAFAGRRASAGPIVGASPRDDPHPGRLADARQARQGNPRRRAGRRAQRRC